MNRKILFVSTVQYVVDRLIFFYNYPIWDDLLFSGHYYLPHHVSFDCIVKRKQAWYLFNDGSSVGWIADKVIYIKAAG